MRALVLHPDRREARPRRLPELALAEAVALAVALPGITVVGSEVVRLPRAMPGLLFGSGKVAELKARIHAEEIGLVLVDGVVSPVQQRNLEREWTVKLLDRTGLILEIFGDRARTREGVMQVELAALSYQKSRLVRAWTHLERQRGGFGFVGGPGETQIEADRRAIEEQVTRLKRALGRVVKTRELHRSARAKVPYPIVALAGYTNAGKSSLFNRMTGAAVEAKDMLFATLDPTMRAIALPGGQKVIMSDTVGFISDLPHELVAAFRATLEEVLSADLVLHVRDISHPESGMQAADVREILERIGLDPAVPVFEVWNKIDLLDEDAREALRLPEPRAGVFAVSAVTGEGFEGLLQGFAAALEAPRLTEELLLPFAEGRRRAWLHGEAVVTGETLDEDGHRIAVRWSERQKARFASVK